MEEDGAFEASEEAEGFVRAIGSVEGGHEGVVLEGAVGGFGNWGVRVRVMVWAWFGEFLGDGEESGEEIGGGGGGGVDGGGGVRAVAVAIEVEEVDEEI